MNKCVAVTGGAGYIGSHVAKALACAGFEPVVFDNLSRGHARAVQWGELYNADLADNDALEAFFKRHQPAAVIHLAAFAYVGESVEQPLLYFSNNVRNSIHLLEAMATAKCKTLVFSSSCSVYGGIHDSPIDETTPTHPASPYARSKLMIEQICRSLTATGDLRYTALRYFNAAGADPAGQIGECHDPEPHLLPNAIAAALQGRELQLFGDDYNTPDGTCVRDYIHVSDLADAHVAAVQKLLHGDTLSPAYNLGNGVGYSILQVIRAVEDVTGQTIKVSIMPRRIGDPPFAIGDATQARQGLNWHPKIPEIQDMIRHHIQWINHQSS